MRHHVRACWASWPQLVLSTSPQIPYYLSYTFLSLVSFLMSDPCFDTKRYVYMFQTFSHVMHTHVRQQNTPKKLNSKLRSINDNIIYLSRSCAESPAISLIGSPACLFTCPRPLSLALLSHNFSYNLLFFCVATMWISLLILFE